MRTQFESERGDHNKNMFKYNGKLWNPKNPEKKLKQLGITWDDVEIIEEKPKIQEDDKVDPSYYKDWMKILILATNYQIVTIDKDRVPAILSQLTPSTSIKHYGSTTLVDDRFLVTPYLEEFPEDVLSDIKEKIVMTYYGYNYFSEEEYNSDMSNPNLVKFKEFADFEKLHSKEQTKKHFNLTEDEYRNLCKKFGMLR